MIDNKTIDGLYALRLPAMAAGLAEQQDQASLSPPELRSNASGCW